MIILINSIFGYKTNGNCSVRLSYYVPCKIKWKPICSCLCLSHTPPSYFYWWQENIKRMVKFVTLECIENAKWTFRTLAR